MGKEKHKEEVVICPVGRFFADLEKMSGKQTTFLKHFNRSRIEFLKAIRSIVDDRIESIEKQGSKKGKKKATKIEVE
jgi:hypothetical protein